MPDASCRIETLIRTLALAPHPEGGFYREVFRSPHRVAPADGRPVRQALTAIYFLLAAGQHSRWHCVASDETWTHLAGDPLELFCFDVVRSHASRVRLGAIAGQETTPLHAVPAGHWQAARPQGSYALVACHVGPGFTFDDFQMAGNDAAVAVAIRAQGEEYRSLL
ncbi:MAG: cupin domain-containing protein [bacterium]